MNTTKKGIIFDNIVKNLLPYDPEKIILFGSFSRDDNREYSDIDLIIIKKTNERFLDRIKKSSRMISGSPHPVDILVYTPEEFEALSRQNTPFSKNMLSDSIVLYEKQKQPVGI